MTHRESLPGTRKIQEWHISLFITTDGKGFSKEIKIIMLCFHKQKLGLTTLPERYRCSRTHNFEVISSQWCSVDQQNNSSPFQHAESKIMIFPINTQCSGMFRESKAWEEQTSFSKRWGKEKELHSRQELQCTSSIVFQPESGSSLKF